MLGIPIDIESDESIRHMVARTLDAFGRLDILVNNAALVSPGDLYTMSDAEWGRLFDKKLNGFARCMRHAIPPMRERRWGRIVNVTGTAGRQPQPTAVATGMNNAAILNMTKAMANDLAKDGILLNAVLPTATLTERHRGGDPQGRGRDADVPRRTSCGSAARIFRSAVMRARTRSPSVVTFLASERASYVVGCRLAGRRRRDGGDLMGETMNARHLPRSLIAALACLGVAFSGSADAQAPDVAKAFAPTGTLRVGVLMVTYFALPDKASGDLIGVVPDLGRELARRLGVPAQLVKYENPVAVIAAFRRGDLDATFIGITADRAAAFDFGPVVLDLQTTYLVPAGSAIERIEDIDRPGVRLLVPARSAQEAFLKKTIAKATMISVAVENPGPAVAKLAAGEADAFSHVVPMLVSAQAALPGARILPGSYYNVPIAIGYAKDRPAAVAAYARQFAEDVKKSGFVRQSLDRAGESVRGVVVSGQ